MKAEWVRLGDILELHRRPVELDAMGTYHRIGIYSWGKGLFRRDAVLGHEMGSLRYFKVPEDALVVSNIQAWEGALALSSSEDSQCLGSNRFLSYLSVDPDQVDARYVLQYLLSEDGFADVRRSSPGTQVRNRTLSKDKFESIPIPVPDIAKQNWITTRLAAATKPAGTVPPRAEMEHWVNALRDRLVMQVGGDSQSLGDVLHRCREWQSIDPVAPYTAIGVRGFGRGLIHYATVPGSGLGKLRYAPLGPHRLIVSNIKAWEGAVAVTGCTSDSRVASNRFLQYEATSANVTVDFIRHYLVSQAGLTQLQKASPGSADRNRTLSMDSFEAITVSVPSREAQDHVSRCMASVASVLELAHRRDALVDALLPAARNEVFSQFR